MKLVFALGNPGPEYADTRHNAGWWLADRLRARWECPPFRVRGPIARAGARPGGEEVLLVKPLTYVNRSGEALRSLAADEDVDLPRDLLVLVDDVALPPGSFRLRARGSSGGHNGLASVQAAVGGQDYARLRIGVGRPHDDRIDLAAWVLAPLPDPEEEAVVTALDRMTDAVEHWLREGIEAAMNRFNG